MPHAPYTPKTWINEPATVTPLNAAAMIDLEQREAAHVDLNLALDPLVKIGAYTVTSADAGRLLLLDASAAGFNVTLPPAAGFPQREILAKKIDGTLNAVTFITTGGETIDGVATVVLDTPNEVLGLAVDPSGPRWQITRTLVASSSGGGGGGGAMENISPPQALSGAVSLDMTGHVNSFYAATLAGNTTLTISNMAPYAALVLRIAQDPVTPRSFTIARASGGVRWPGGQAPVLTQVANAIDIFTLVGTPTGINIEGSVFGQDLSFVPTPGSPGSPTHTPAIFVQATEPTTWVEGDLWFQPI